MKLVFNIIEKIPQLTKLELIEKLKNKRLIIDGKRFLNARNFMTYDKKVIKKILIKIKLIKTKI